MELPPFLKETNQVYIIAEAGINHNGNFDLAVQLIRAAATAGTDAIKFQNFITEDFITDRSVMYTYKSQGKEVTESFWVLCKRCEVPREWLPRLKKIADECGIAFLSTPTSSQGVDDLVSLKVKALKNGSDYLSHLPLLRYMGSTGLPVIISTGMAFEEEVRDAVHAVQSGGSSPVIILHCTSCYPTQPSDVNLRRMLTLQSIFNCPVGLSDHTLGSAAAVQAVTLGALVIEKTFTLDHNLPGPDHWFILNPEELRRYVQDIRDAEKRMGSPRIAPAQGEQKNRDEFRLSVVAARDLSVGQIIEVRDLMFAKPGTGLPPKEAERIIGRRLVTPLKAGTPFQHTYFE